MNCQFEVLCEQEATQQLWRKTGTGHWAKQHFCDDCAQDVWTETKDTLSPKTMRIIMAVPTALAVGMTYELRDREPEIEEVKVKRVYNKVGIERQRIVETIRQSRLTIENFWGEG